MEDYKQGQTDLLNHLQTTLRDICNTSSKDDIVKDVATLLVTLEPLEKPDQPPTTEVSKEEEEERKEILNYLNRLHKLLISCSTFDFNNEYDKLEGYELESFIKEYANQANQPTEPSKEAIEKEILDWLVGDNENVSFIADRLLNHFTQKAVSNERTLLIEFLDSIRDYGHESHNLIGNYERESSEFVDIFLRNKLTK